MYGHLLVRGNYKNLAFLQTSGNSDKSTPHQDRGLVSVSMHTVTPDPKEGGGDHVSALCLLLKRKGVRW